MAVIQRGRLASYVGETPFRACAGHRSTIGCAVVVGSADAIQLGKLVLGEGKRSALDVLAQMRDG
jgi:hypothetical protein